MADLLEIPGDEYDKIFLSIFDNNANNNENNAKSDELAHKEVIKDRNKKRRYIHFPYNY